MCPAEQSGHKYKPPPVRISELNPWSGHCSAQRTGTDAEAVCTNYKGSTDIRDRQAGRKMGMETSGSKQEKAV